ncbi:SGNH/GDSL hydrolase family protein [Methylobacterium sp. WSM2598]|uniref:SGNH/GDSL hydrolase family protein n=1 Tax=Methylobacterium sp. WSM2598 TaxID=398261 RepID=UPI000374ECBC|nr:GDSL-type esterase/lipase family protein [Methylobacterium sp. WSM2598]
MALALPSVARIGLTCWFGLVGLGTAAAQAQQPPRPGSAATVVAPGPDVPDPSLSPECRVPGSKLYTLAKLRAVKKALREQRAIHVLSLGSTSGGLGAVTYPVKLESALEQSLPDVTVDVDSRGLPGEITYGATERVRNIVAEIEPDLVVWQVGSNDALARVDVEAFASSLADTIDWIKSHDIDVVLVDPQYTASLAQDDYYNSFVRAIQRVAAEKQVPLVLRFEAMRYLALHAKGDGLLGSGFRLADLGQRCMAEHVTRAITVSLLQPDVTGTTPPPAAPVAAGKPSP